jgi:hypothetical protein
MHVMRGMRLRLDFRRITALIYYLTVYSNFLFNNAAARIRRSFFIRLFRISVYGSAEADVIYVKRRA